MPIPFNDRLLRVDLSRGEISLERLNPVWLRLTLGGAGLATRYLLEELPPGIDPLSPTNLLIFMSGMLTGTPSASASRYSVVAKSPQTGYWGHANSGGYFGPALKWSGFDGIILEGASDHPVYLLLSDGQAELRPADHLWGLTISATEDQLQAEIGKPATIASIGPAGENQVLYAAIMNNKHRAAGRTGMGAVMGAKKLKAIVCIGRQSLPINDPATFKKVTQRQFDYMDESILKIGFDTFGTNMIADMVNVRGGYPTHNWQSSTFDQIDQVNAQAMTEQVLVKGVRCYSCPVACGRGTQIRSGKWEGDRGEGPEYETTNTLGSMCGVSDINAITKANYLCNDYGLDSISAGSTIAFAMECYQNGILTKEHTGELPFEFGNADTVISLVEMIARRQGIGDLLSLGTLRMAQILGGGSQHFAMQVKGLELPAYDPRAAKITGLGYSTATRGGDHMNAYIQGPTFIDVPFLIVDESSIHDPFTADPQEAFIVADMENALNALDCLGGCKFMGVLLTTEELTDLVNAATGWNISIEEFRLCGERLQNMVRIFNAREGLRREHDTLPERLMKDPLPDGPAQGMVLERKALESMKDAYYAARGWDLYSGLPTFAKLRELGLENLEW